MPAWAGSTQWTEPASAAGIAAAQAVDGCDQSWICAPQARLGERPG